MIGIARVRLCTSRVLLALGRLPRWSKRDCKSRLRWFAFDAMKPSLLEILQQDRTQPALKSGRGVVIRGGSESRMVNAWISARFLRHFGCALPIEVWSTEAVSPKWAEAFREIGAEARMPGDAGEKDERLFDLPTFALLHGNFDEVLYLDSFTVPVQDVTGIFECAQFVESGALFWPGSGSLPKELPLWGALDMEYCAGRFDAGQCVLRLSSVWEALDFSAAINAHIFTNYKPLHRAELINDGVFLAWQKFGMPFGMPTFDPHLMKFPGLAACRPNVVVQHDFEKNALFQRRIHPRRQLGTSEPWIPGLMFEATCQRFMRELRGLLKRDVMPVRTARIDSMRKELMEGAWMLFAWNGFHDGRNTPMDSQGTKGNDGSIAEFELEKSKKKPMKVVSSGRELHFAEGDSFGRWSDDDLSSWRLNDADGAMSLVLSSPSREVATLVQAPSGEWSGTRSYWGKTKEIVLRRFDEFVSQVSASSMLRVCNSSTRLGDHVASLYALCGLAERGTSIQFFTPFCAWFSGVAHPGLTILEAIPLDDDVLDLNQFKGKERRLADSQAKTYGRILGTAPKRPVRVSVPSVAGALNWRNSVLLFPLDTAAGLEWPVAHWQRLIVLLRESGYEVIGVGSEKSAARLETVFSPLAVFWVIDPAIDWLMDAMRNSVGVIATGNAGAHLAGLYEVPCVAIHSQLPASYLWDFAPSVSGIVPETDCSGCLWDMNRGYDPVCELGCSAMYGVSPGAVLARFKQITKGVASV